MAAKPQVLKGFRDLLPRRMRLTQHVIQTATDVFERFGFEPLATPALEYADTLAGKSGEETDTLFYRFQDNILLLFGYGSENMIDLAVSFCRRAYSYS